MLWLKFVFVSLFWRVRSVDFLLLYTFDLTWKEREKDWCLGKILKQHIIFLIFTFIHIRLNLEGKREREKLMSR